MKFNEPMKSFFKCNRVCANSRSCCSMEWSSRSSARRAFCRKITVTLGITHRCALLARSRPTRGFRESMYSAFAKKVHRFDLTGTWTKEASWAADNRRRPGWIKCRRIFFYDSLKSVTSRRWATVVPKRITNSKRYDCELNLIAKHRIYIKNNIS